MATSKTKKPKAAMPHDEIEQLLGQIEKAEEKVQIELRGWEARREEAKIAKAGYDTAVGELCRLCRTRQQWAEEGEKQPLLATTEEVTVGDVTFSASPEAVAAALVSDILDWRSFTLAKAGIDGRAGKALTEAGIDTLGKLVDLQAEQGEWWQRSVKGVGHSSRDEIENCIENFWREHPEYCETAT